MICARPTLADLSIMIGRARALAPLHSYWRHVDDEDTIYKVVGHGIGRTDEAEVEYRQLPRMVDLGNGDMAEVRSISDPGPFNFHRAISQWGERFIRVYRREVWSTS